MFENILAYIYLGIRFSTVHSFGISTERVDLGILCLDTLCTVCPLFYYCQAQFPLTSSVQVQLKTETRLRSKVFRLEKTLVLTLLWKGVRF